MKLLDSFRGAFGKRRSEERRWGTTAPDAAAAEVEGASELASAATDAVGDVTEALADAAQSAADASNDAAAGRSADSGVSGDQSEKK